MNIERLKYFMSLAETLNFTETAEEFYTTQSNISKQIMNLEKELDTILFSREHRGIKLTPAGKALLPYAARLLEDYGSLEHALLPYHNAKNMTLRICSIPVMMNYNITDLIAQFHDIHPNILLQIKEIESSTLLRTVDDGECDIAYTRIFDLNSEKYEKITVKQDRFVAILPKQHPLATNSLLSLIELKEEHFYQLDIHTQLYQQFCTLCKQAKFQPRVAYTGTHIPNILDFVSKGLGVSLLMEHSFDPTRYPSLVCIPLETTIQSELAFIRHRSLPHSLASEYFWNYISSHSNNSSKK